MPPRQDSRKRLVQAALKLFATRGYYHTSIADVLRESGCKRGTLYYYFSSKEDLGYAAIDEALRLIIEKGAASHLRINEHPIDRLSKALDGLPNLVEVRGILISGTDIAARMASVHEGFRRRLQRGLEPPVDQVEEVVRTGVAEGQIADTVNTRQLAHAIVTMGAGIQHVSLLWDREAIWEDARRWLKEYLNSLRR